MKLTVLGGSAAGGNTGAGCAGFLVETNNANLVLDLGPGTLLELRKHTDFRRLDGIVISHLHVDHVLDLAALRYALAYNPLRPRGRIPLWMPPGGTAFLCNLATALAVDGKHEEFFSAVFEIAEYDPATVMQVGDARFTLAPTVHYIPCWAMRVTANGASGDLFYTGDTGPAADLGALAQGAAVVVSEATLPEPSAEPVAARGHLTAREAATLARDAGTETLILTHWWEEHGRAAYQSAAADVFDGRLELASPGLAIAW